MDDLFWTQPDSYQAKSVLTCELLCDQDSQIHVFASRICKVVLEGCEVLTTSKTCSNCFSLYFTGLLAKSLSMVVIFHIYLSLLNV